MSEFGLLFFGTAIGFAVAGLIASAYRCVTGEPLGFALHETGEPVLAFLGILVRTIAGPFLLARSAVMAFDEDEPRLAWCLVAVTLACVWGFLSGVIVLETFTSLSAPATAAAVGTL